MVFSEGAGVYCGGTGWIFEGLSWIADTIRLVKGLDAEAVNSSSEITILSSVGDGVLTT